jgi:hypothetical protein
MSDARRHNEDDEFSEQPAKNQTEVTPEINSSVDVSSSAQGTAKRINVDTPAHSRIMAPRNEGGKRQSSHNSTKHGIFSAVILLKGESREKYESLLRQLLDALQPEGKLEELLVEKLATIAWRYRRLLIAEAAEISKGTQFIEWDQRTKAEEESEDFGGTSILDTLGENCGLIRKIRNPTVLECCLELLAELERGIKANGFDRERDAEILDKL